MANSKFLCYTTSKHVNGFVIPLVRYFNAQLLKVLLTALLNNFTNVRPERFQVVDHRAGASGFVQLIEDFFGRIKADEGFFCAPIHVRMCVESTVLQARSAESVLATLAGERPTAIKVCKCSSTLWIRALEGQNLVCDPLVGGTHLANTKVHQSSAGKHTHTHKTQHSY